MAVDSYQKHTLKEYSQLDQRITWIQRVEKKSGIGHYAAEVENGSSHFMTQLFFALAAVILVFTAIYACTVHLFLGKNNTGKI